MIIPNLRPFLIFGLILALIAFSVGIYPECIILDPKDSSTFNSWSSCDEGQQMFAIKEYNVDLFDEPFDGESRFAFSNTGSGQFCMESAFATALSENLFSDIVFKIESDNRLELILSVFDDIDEDEVSFQYSFKENGWVHEEGWLTSVENYKVSEF